MRPCGSTNTHSSGWRTRSGCTLRMAGMACRAKLAGPAARAIPAAAAIRPAPGTGGATSCHSNGARSDSGPASSWCSNVVPVRGTPTMNTGAWTGAAPIAGALPQDLPQPQAAGQPAGDLGADPEQAEWGQPGAQVRL